MSETNYLLLILWLISTNVAIFILFSIQNKINNLQNQANKQILEFFKTFSKDAQSIIDEATRIADKQNKKQIN